MVWGYFLLLCLKTIAGNNPKQPQQFINLIKTLLMMHHKDLIRLIYSQEGESTDTKHPKLMSDLKFHHSGSQQSVKWFSLKNFLIDFEL